MIILTTTFESTAYECNEKLLVRFALFGILVLYCLSALNEAGITAAGLRGGPLEERARWAVRPLIHVETGLWLAILGMTIFATYVGADRNVARSCWSDNPCEYAERVIPSACSLNGTAVELTPACEAIWNDSETFQQCFDEWTNLAGAVMWRDYVRSEPSTDPATVALWPLKPIFRPVNASAPLDCSLKGVPYFYSKQFQAFLDKIFGRDAASGAVRDQAIEDAVNVDRLSLYYEELLLSAMGLNYSANSAGSDAPWFACSDATCQALIAAGDTCTDWRTMLNAPSSSDRKSAFLATVYASWALLAVQALVAYMAFNAWPDYDQEEAWEGTVKRWGRMLTCGGGLEEAETESGAPAAREIGTLLHQLFGGIDLDPSDQFLGMFLVSERQRLRRHRHAMEALAAAGVVPSPTRRSRLGAAWHAVTVRPAAAFTDWYHARGDLKLVATLGEEAGELKLESAGASTATLGGGSGGQTGTFYMASGALLTPSLSGSGGGPPAQPSPASGSSGSSDGGLSTLPPSPFDVTAGADAPKIVEASPPPRRSIAFTPPSIAASFVRLVSLRPSLTATHDHRSIPRRRDARREMSIAEAEGGGGEAPPPKKGALPIGTARKKLVVESRPQPLTTPVTLHSLAGRLSVSSYEAAALYGLGAGAKAVSRADLEEALDLSWLAKAAYGLQSARWAAAAETSGWCERAADRAAACALARPLRAPLGLDARFRRRNFEAILHLAGVEAADLLYVSYTSAAFGIIPYLVMLHRPTASVVVSVRGTVGLNDMLTDVLSNPVDASAYLPAWVGAELGPGAAAAAHAGILSSTKAVLKDLREKGLLAAMMRAAGADAVRHMEAADWTEAGGEESLQDTGANGATVGEGEKVTAAGAAPEAVLGDAPAAAAESRRVLSRLRTLRRDDEVELDLGHAQSVVGEAVGVQGWRVVVTGHSLGAAVACMMSFQLREYFPDLRCFAYNPPGGLMSINLARLARRFCTSVVVGADAISRVSFPNAQRVVDDMVLALARCKRPKLAIMWDVMAKRRKDPATAPPTFCAFEDVGPEAEAALRRYVATSRLHAASADSEELYPPGRVIHLRPFAAAGAAGRRPANDVWDAVWTTGEDIVGEGLLLTMQMMAHHRVLTMQAALRSAIAGEAAATAGEPGGADDEV